MYVDTKTGTLVSLGWAAKQYGFKSIKEPVTTGVLDYCNLASYEPVEPLEGFKVVMSASLNGDVWLQDVEPKTAEELASEATAAARQAISLITVTTAAGNTFDGDIAAQDAMSRAITAATDDNETTDWKLADNSWIQVNRVELKEALRLAGLQQTTIMKG